MKLAPPLGPRVNCTHGAAHVPFRHRCGADFLLVQRDDRGGKSEPVHVIGSVEWFERIAGTRAPQSPPVRLALCPSRVQAGWALVAAGRSPARPRPVDRAFEQWSGAEAEAP